MQMGLNDNIDRNRSLKDCFTASYEISMYKMQKKDTGISSNVYCQLKVPPALLHLYLESTN
jgi:hypothetical protein